MLFSNFRLLPTW